MITIGIDARTYFFRSGLGCYCRNIIASLTKEPGECRFILWLSNQKSPSDFPLDIRDCLEVRISQAPFGSFEADRTILSREVNGSSVDVFFSPYSPIPSTVKAPCVLTVHDLTPFRFAEMHLESTVQYFQNSLSESLKTVDAIVADSEHTASDIRAFFPETAIRISVVPLGVEESFSTEAASEFLSEILTKYGLKGKDYILYVGNLEARKNLLRTVQAYEQSCLRRCIPLLLAGAPRWGSEEVLNYIHRNNLSPQVRRLDYVSDEDLPALYRGALFFVYVSLYEGFGLPVLESLASGTPALVSNSSSLPEVAGDAAFFVNPLKIDEIRAGMERLFSDASLRANLSAAGILRAKGFTWKRAAEKLGRILVDIAGR